MITGIVPNSLVKSPIETPRPAGPTRLTAAQCQLRRALRCHGPAAQHQQTAHGVRLCPARGGVLPDTLPALTRQQSRPYVAESAAQWTRSPVRRTSRSSSSPWPPAAPRVPAPLVAAHAHVFGVILAAAHAAPLLRAAPGLRGLHRRPQTACFGRGSTAKTAAAVTAWSHAMLLPPALWCCACPCGAAPGRDCTRRGLCG